VEGRGGVGEGPTAAFALIRQRSFGPYFAGNALSASGGWFHNLAASLLVFRLTHSAFWLGVVNFAQFLPILVLAPWAGAVADRHDRRKLLLVAQVAAIAISAALGALAYAGRATTGVVIGFCLALGVVSSFSAPAQQALILSLVQEDEVPTAVALNSMTFNIARAVGPALAALVVETLGIAPAFLLNAASFLVFAVALLAIRPRPQKRASREESRLRDSIAMLRREPRLAAFLAIVAIVGFASDPVNTEAPALAEAFGRRDTVAGYLIGLFGAGAVVAAFLVAGRVTASARRMAGTLALLGAAIAGVALMPWLPPALVLLFAAGFGYLATNTAATTRLQLGVAENQRGRIMALWSVAFLGLRPFASIADGALAATFGVRVAAVALALPALAAAAALALVLRE
jgi:MFS family permease